MTNNDLFRIMGEFGGKTEELDDTACRKEAERLAREYRVAFGESWRVWVEEPEEEE
jgi:hypothetical protein